VTPSCDAWLSCALSFVWNETGSVLLIIFLGGVYVAFSFQHGQRFCSFWLLWQALRGLFCEV